MEESFQAMPRRISQTPGSNMGSHHSDSSSKERLKWTQELHDRFENAVAQLGGPERATPKGILKVMGVAGLTIYHVKSHLQKYRMSKLIPETDFGGKSERRNISEILPNFCATSRAQLDEAIHMQMEAQRKMSDHLEVQRSLKVKIAAQGKFMDSIIEEFRNRAPSARLGKPYSPGSLPSLCEESESTDSEADRNEIRSGEVHRASKRIRINDGLYDFESLCFPKGARSLLSSQDQSGYPWSVSSYQLPLLPALYNPPNQVLFDS